MKTRLDFIKALHNPTPDLVLKKWPEGNIFQFWADNPELYAKAFGQKDDIYPYAGGHTGIDISGPHRSDVVPAFDGTLTSITTNRTSLGGVMAVITSEELEDGPDIVRFESIYGHLDEVDESYAGKQVKAGQRGIAKMGNTGFVISGGTPYWGTAPAGVGTHVHFGLTEYIKKYVNHSEVWQKRHSNLQNGTTDPMSYYGKSEGWLIFWENLRKYLNKLLAESGSETRIP